MPFRPDRTLPLLYAIILLDVVVRAAVGPGCGPNLWDLRYDLLTQGRILEIMTLQLSSLLMGGCYKSRYGLAKH